RPPVGRTLPRWSVVITRPEWRLQPAGSPVSTAGLPGCGARVCVQPPLSAKASSIGSMPTMLPAPLNAHASVPAEFVRLYVALTSRGEVRGASGVGTRLARFLWALRCRVLLARMLFAIMFAVGTGTVGGVRGGGGVLFRLVAAWR